MWKLFEIHEAEAKRLLDLYKEFRQKRSRFPLLPTYDHVLKCSNLFNTLDARGAISVTERVGVIGRVRKLAVGVAESWVDQCDRRFRLSFRRAFRGQPMNLLLEIGAEEIPDWMLSGALSHLADAVGGVVTQNKLGDPALRTDATPRRLVVRAEGLISRQPDSEERVWGPAKSAAPPPWPDSPKNKASPQNNSKSSTTAKPKNTATSAKPRDAGP